MHYASNKNDLNEMLKIARGAMKTAHVPNKLVHEQKRLSIRRLQLIAYSVGAILGILFWDDRKKYRSQEGQARSQGDHR